MNYYKIIYNFMNNKKNGHFFIKSDTAESAKQFFLDILDDNSYAYNILDVILDSNITEDDICLNFDMAELLLPV